jgi:hypothetical protein
VEHPSDFLQHPSGEGSAPHRYAHRLGDDCHAAGSYVLGSRDNLDGPEDQRNGLWNQLDGLLLNEASATGGSFASVDAMRPVRAALTAS